MILIVELELYLAVDVLVTMAVRVCRAAHLAGSDDEEHFQNKDRARLVRDKLRLNPVILGRRPYPFDIYAV